MWKLVSTTSGERFATIHGVRPMRKSSVDNSALDPRHQLLAGHNSVKDPGGSYWMTSLVLAARRLWLHARIEESGHMTVRILKTRVLCAVQVSQVGSDIFYKSKSVI